MLTQVQKLCCALLLFPLAALLAAPCPAKSNVDLNPDLDFTQYKTFAFIGGTEHLSMQQLNPHLIRDTVHDAVSHALTQRGLKEVGRDEHPDLVVRYLAESSEQMNYSGSDDDMGGYDRFTVDWWAQSWTVWYSSVSRNGALVIDLIDAKRRQLAWRLFLQQQILNVDKLPEKISQEIAKGFESYPPSDKEKEAVRKEHAKPVKNKPPQFQ
jgi:Domain of unknown function (DUF4136)